MYRYQKIFQAIQARINSGEWAPGVCLPSETELAKEFGVTRITLRKAMEALKQNGRVVGQPGRGTFVSAPHKGGLEAVYVGDTMAHFHKELFLALSKEAQERHLRLTPFHVSCEGGETRLEGLHRYLEKCSSVVVSHMAYPQVSHLLSKTSANLVVVGTARIPVNRPASFILSDLGGGISQAVSYLAGLGHRSIALLTPEDSAQLNGGNGVSQILKPYVPAFRAATLKYGLDDSASLALITARDQEKDIVRLQEVLRKPGRPTAFVCDGDFRARLLYTAAMREKIEIPGQLSVVGLSDTPWAEALIPRLTSVNLGESTVARLAILLCIESAPVQKEIVAYAAPEVRERESCRKI